MNTHSYLIWRLAFSRSGGLVRKERQAWEVTKPAGWVPSESALAANLVHKERQVSRGAARVGSVSGPPGPRWRSVVRICLAGYLGSESETRLRVARPVEGGEHLLMLD